MCNIILLAVFPCAHAFRQLRDIEYEEQRRVFTQTEREATANYSRLLGNFVMQHDVNESRAFKKRTACQPRPLVIAP